MTDNFLKYLKEECLVFKVFGYPDVSDVKKKEAKADAIKKKAASEAVQASVPM